MAKANNNMAKYFNLVLVLSLLLIISTVEGRSFGFGSGKQDSTPTCTAVYGVESADTCFSVTEQFKLSSAEFSAINPNVDCDKLFIGQWLCVEGEA